MNIPMKELLSVLEQKEKAVFLYNTSKNALPLLAACDQMEAYIGELISDRIIMEMNMENPETDDGLNNYVGDNYDPVNEEDYYDYYEDEYDEDNVENEFDEFSEFDNESDSDDEFDGDDVGLEFEEIDDDDYEDGSHDL